MLIKRELPTWFTTSHVKSKRSKTKCWLGYILKDPLVILGSKKERNVVRIRVTDDQYAELSHTESDGTSLITELQHNLSRCGISLHLIDSTKTGKSLDVAVFQGKSFLTNILIPKLLSKRIENILVNKLPTLNASDSTELLFNLRELVMSSGNDISLKIDADKGTLTVTFKLNGNIQNE